MWLLRGFVITGCLTVDPLEATEGLTKNPRLAGHPHIRYHHYNHKQIRWTNHLSKFFFDFCIYSSKHKTFVKTSPKNVFSIFYSCQKDVFWMSKRRLRMSFVYFMVVKKTSSGCQKDVFCLLNFIAIHRKNITHFQESMSKRCLWNIYTVQKMSFLSLLYVLTLDNTSRKQYKDI